MLKTIFMGTPDFATQCLKSLENSGHEILAVVTKPDVPSGRGMKLVPSDVKKYAIENGYKILEPEKVKKNKEFIDQIKELKPDVLCVVAYGHILPKEILDIPKFGAVNVHGSILPKYRGSAPIQWAVINGDDKTGVTAIFIDEGMDSGDIIGVKETKIGKDETTGELYERLAKIGGELLIETLDKIENNTIQRIKQADEYTIAPMLDKSIAKIDWENMTKFQIKNLVRGLNPIMGAITQLNANIYKLWKVDIVEDNSIIDDINSFKSGEIILQDSKKGLFIKAKDGIISVLEIQGPNAKRMNIFDFLRGRKI